MAYGYACDCLDEVTCDCGKCSLCGELYEDCCCDDEFDDWHEELWENPFAPCLECHMDADQCVCGFCLICGPEGCDCSPTCPGCGSHAWLPDDECPDCGWLPGPDAHLVELGAGDEFEDTGEDDVPF